MDSRTRPANAEPEGAVYAPYGLAPGGATISDLPLAEMIPQIAFVADGEGRIVGFNRCWYDYVGGDAAAVGDPSAARDAALHPDERADAEAQWLEARKTGAAYAQRLRLRAADGTYRWFLVHVSPHVADGVRRWVGTCADIDDDRRQAQRFAFLARAGEVLAESLDQATTLDRLLGIIVPELADWAAIDLFDEQDRLRTVAAVHADPAKAPLVKRLCGRHTHSPRFDQAVSAALRSRPPKAIPQISEALLVSAAAPELLDVIMALRPHSTVTVPLRSRGKTLGSFVAYWAETPRRYGDDDVPLFVEIAKRAAVSIENAAIYAHEREIASRFQKAALPLTMPVDSGYRFDVVYQPATSRAEVGGDWYDAVLLADGRLVVSIGDVAGSGLAAAVIMAAMRQVIRGVAQVYADPSAMLDAADRTLKSEYPDTFVTAFVGIFDRVAGTLAYASAGHHPPLVRDPDGSVRPLRSGGVPLGLGVRGEFTTRVVGMAEGTLVTLYTDGLIEAQHDLDGSERRLVELLADPALTERADVAHVLFDAMLEGGCQDDVVILTIGVEPMRHDAAHEGLRRRSFASVDAEASKRVREEFVAALAERGAAPNEIFSAELVFGELIGNVVRYAPGDIDVALDVDAAMPVLHVLDRGPGFVLVPRLPSDLLSERGRGLFLVWSLSEDFNVSRREDGGSHARAVLPLTRRYGRHRAPATMLETAHSAPMRIQRTDEYQRFSRCTRHR